MSTLVVNMFACFDRRVLRLRSKMRFNVRTKRAYDREWHNKYTEALAMYNTHLHDDEVAHILHHLVEEHAAENDTVEVKKLLFNCSREIGRASCRERV